MSESKVLPTEESLKFDSELVKNEKETQERGTSHAPEKSPKKELKFYERKKSLGIVKLENKLVKEETKMENCFASCSLEKPSLEREHKIEPKLFYQRRKSLKVDKVDSDLMKEEIEVKSCHLLYSPEKVTPEKMHGFMLESKVSQGRRSLEVDEFNDDLVKKETGTQNGCSSCTPGKPSPARPHRDLKSSSRVCLLDRISVEGDLLLKSPSVGVAACSADGGYSYSCFSTVETISCDNLQDVDKLQDASRGDCSHLGSDALIDLNMSPFGDSDVGVCDSKDFEDPFEHQFTIDLASSTDPNFASSVFYGDSEKAHAVDVTESQDVLNSCDFNSSVDGSGGQVANMYFKQNLDSAHCMTSNLHQSLELQAKTDSSVMDNATVSLNSLEPQLCMDAYSQMKIDKVADAEKDIPDHAKSIEQVSTPLASEHLSTQSRDNKRLHTETDLTVTPRKKPKIRRHRPKVVVEGKVKKNSRQKPNISALKYAVLTTQLGKREKRKYVKRTLFQGKKGKIDRGSQESSVTELHPINLSFLSTERKPGDGNSTEGCVGFNLDEETNNVLSVTTEEARERKPGDGNSTEGGMGFNFDGETSNVLPANKEEATVRKPGDSNSSEGAGFYFDEEASNMLPTNKEEEDSSLMLFNSNLTIYPEETVRRSRRIRSRKEHKVYNFNQDHDHGTESAINLCLHYSSLGSNFPLKFKKKRSKRRQFQSYKNITLFFKSLGFHFISLGCKRKRLSRRRRLHFSIFSTSNQIGTSNEVGKNTIEAIGLCNATTFDPMNSISQEERSKEVVQLRQKEQPLTNTANGCDLIEFFPGLTLPKEVIDHLEQLKKAADRNFLFMKDNRLRDAEKCDPVEAHRQSSSYDTFWLLNDEEKIDFLCHKLRTLKLADIVDVNHPGLGTNLSKETKAGVSDLVPYQPNKKLERKKRLEELRLALVIDDGMDKESLDKERERKKKEAEIEIFKGRALSFNSKMHLFLGDRRFKPWKGSVVDSVVGVFLTQNVSDNLSSSAYLSLAAKFPLQSTSNQGHYGTDMDVKISNGENCDLQVARYFVTEPAACMYQERKNDGTETSEFILAPEGRTEGKSNAIPCEEISRLELVLKSTDTENKHESANTTSCMNRECQSNSTETSNCISDTEGQSERNSFAVPCEKISGLDLVLKFTDTKNAHESAKTTPSVNQKKHETKDAESKDWNKLRSIYDRGRNMYQTDSVDWEAVRKADVNKVADAIRQRGQHRIIAKKVQNFLDKVVELHGCIDLEWLRYAPPDDVKQFLLEIYGIGLKSVECIRLLSLQHVAFPVDINVGRIAVRLGWVPLQPLPGNLQLHLLEEYPIMDSIQEYLWPRLQALDHSTLYLLHYHMITFGKVFCKKKNPNCNACPMRAECRHYASAVASANLCLPWKSNAEQTRSVDSRNLIEGLHELGNAGRTDNSISTTLLESNTSPNSCCRSHNCEPVIEEPKYPEEPVVEEPKSPEELPDIEDFGFYNRIDYDSNDDEIPVIKLNNEEFNKNVMYFLDRYSNSENDPNLSRAIVPFSVDATSIPEPVKLKNVRGLRTEHHVYELPDDHELLIGLPRREYDDPGRYLLAIWSPGETESSYQPPQALCNSKGSDLCDDNNCFACQSIREERTGTVRATILLPCRTVLNGRFPLNGTYFQTNEVFADHETSLNPLVVPRHLLWNLKRRTVYAGTSTSAIFKGLTAREIQANFWQGYVCVREFDRKTREPKTLSRRLHCPQSKMDKKRRVEKKPTSDGNGFQTQT